jgi:hypothetical protein
MVVAYNFDMQSPGTTKDSLFVTNRQVCNMAMIAFWEKGEFHIRLPEEPIAHTGQSTCFNEQTDKSDNQNMSGW